MDSAQQWSADRQRRGRTRMYLTTTRRRWTRWRKTGTGVRVHIGVAKEGVEGSQGRRQGGKASSAVVADSAAAAAAADFAAAAAPLLLQVSLTLLLLLLALLLPPLCLESYC